MNNIHIDNNNKKENLKIIDDEHMDETYKQDGKHATHGIFEKKIYNSNHIKYDQNMPKVTRYTDNSGVITKDPRIWDKISKKELGMQISFMLFMTYIINYSNMYNTIPSFIFISITMDSLHTAISFFRLHIFNGDLSQSQTLKKIKTLYTITLVDRYIYYACLGCLHKFICWAFWNTINPIIFYICMSLCSPEIMEKLSDTVLHRIFIKLNNEKFKITKIIVAKQLAHILNILFYETVQMKANIDYIELMPLLENMNTTLKLFYRVVSNFLIAIVIHYVKTINNSLYLRMLQLTYFYKTGTAISALDKEKAKEEFVTTILLRKWSNLLKPDTFQIIFYIFQNDKKNKFISDIKTAIDYTFIQICALWTIGNILSLSSGSTMGNTIIPIISLLLLLYRYIMDHKLLLKLHIIWAATKDNTMDIAHKQALVTKKIGELEEINKKQINATQLQLKTNTFFMGYNYQPLFPIIAYIMGWYETGLLGICIISECGYYIFCNKIMYSLSVYLYNKLRKFTKKAIHYNKYNRFIFSIGLYIKLLTIVINDDNYVFISTNQRDVITNIIMIYNIIFLLINELDQIKIFITLFFISFGMLSNYDNYHLSYLSIYLYFAFNMIDYFYADILNDFDIFKVSISLNNESLKDQIQKSHNLRIFDSYYNEGGIPPLTRGGTPPLAPPIGGNSPQARGGVPPLAPPIGGNSPQARGGTPPLAPPVGGNSPLARGGNSPSNTPC
jgi:hypothetical protein